jgi:hypothetical protein
MWLKLFGRRFFIERRGKWGLVYGYVGKPTIPKKEGDDANG